MPISVTQTSWIGSLGWLAGLVLVGFLVSWVAATRVGLSRRSYIAVLAIVTGATTAGYVGWLGVGVGDVLGTHWTWGLLAAPLAGVFLVLGVRRLPVTRRLSGARLLRAMLWEGVVYGVAEGVLLSALPVLMSWEAISALGWSGPGGALARWTLPIVASVTVIVAHHLGYPEYRNRLLVPVSVGCGLMSVGFLVTASLIAPTVAHVLSHASALRHGAELPPHHPGGAPPAPRTGARSVGRADRAAQRIHA